MSERIRSHGRRPKLPVLLESSDTPGREQAARAASLTISGRHTHVFLTGPVQTHDAMMTRRMKDGV